MLPTTKICRLGELRKFEAFPKRFLGHQIVSSVSTGVSTIASGVDRFLRDPMLQVSPVDAGGTFAASDAGRTPRRARFDLTSAGVKSTKTEL